MSTIMAVDDDPGVLAALRRALRKFDHRLLATASAHEALQVLRQEEVALIICDQMMPEMTGAELLLQAKTVSPQTIRVMLTGNVNIENAIAAINLGEVSYFVSKPWDNEELCTVVDNALARADLIKENERLSTRIQRQNEELRQLNRELEQRVAERTTELTAKNRELQRATERLLRVQASLIQDKKVAAIGKLAGGVAHEMNNPLTGVVGYAQILAQSEQDAERKSYLDCILQEGERCQKIVENLLRFARSHPTRRAPMSLPDLVDECLRLMSYELRQINAKASVCCTNEVPPIVADAGQLQQVIVNVLENACQSLAETEGIRRIEVAISALKDDRVRVEFADTGRGIDESIIDRIFEPFFTTRDVGKGVGLGLSLAYGVMRDHGGQIYAARDVKSGANIVIELPVGRDDLAIEPKPHPGL